MTYLLLGKNAVGASIEAAYRTDLGMIAGRVQLIVPFGWVSPSEYQMWWLKRPVQTATTASRLSGS